MIEYFKWIVCPQNLNSNIFTLLSVVLSGIVSWLLSAYYYRKGNRNSLKAAVLHPVRCLLEDSPTWKGYQSLIEYKKDFSLKYMTNYEHTVFDDLLVSYKAVCHYKYENVCAESLESYFRFKLKKQGIDPTPVPIWVEGEIVDVEMPPEMLYFRDDIQRAIEQYPPEYDEDKCRDCIVDIFDHYCSQCYTDKKVIFFDDHSLLEVLSKAKNKNDWDVKFKRYEEAKGKFLEKL